MGKLFEAKFAAMTAKMDAAMRIKEGIVSSSDDVDTDTQDNSDDDSTTTATAKRGKGKATAKRALTAVHDSTAGNNNSTSDTAHANSDKTATKGKQPAVKKARHSDSGTIELVNNNDSIDGADTVDDEPMFAPVATEGNHTYYTLICCHACVVMCRSCDIVLWCLHTHTPCV
jgi:hypothetical protein